MTHLNTGAKWEYRLLYEGSVRSRRMACKEIEHQLDLDGEVSELCQVSGITSVRSFSPHH
jgi:hypothetical protein